MTFLATDDVRALLRLVGEVRELGDDPTTWRRHALEGLSRLCGARAGSALEHWLPGDLDAVTALPPWAFLPRPPTAQGEKGIYVAQNLGVGYESPRAEKEIHAAKQDQANNPAWPALRACCMRPCTRTRRELVDRRVWQRSLQFARLREAGKVGEYLVSFQPVPALGLVNILGLFRGPDEPPFTEEQAAVVALFHDELGRGWRAAPLAQVAALPPRQAAVMRLLLQGKREKEIADELAIAQGTVHQHVAALYRRLGVSSRGELAAFAAAAERRSGPKLVRTEGPRRR
ncbi:MAG TPA: LuxR C-terminal-related transcriptional regulator [Polyangiaceae bacterium]|nr:LuxR C-terminal-related transcriptional regulator [Polyangiaceae bacterium]